MDVLDKIKTKLAKYPEASYDFDEISITVHPTSSSGFPVTMIIRNPGYTVYFDSWHEEFESEEEALNCFIFGLSTQCRLKVELRGSSAYKWTVEFLENGEWKEDSTTGLLLVPFWKKTEVIYLQNNLIKIT